MSKARHVDARHKSRDARWRRATARLVRADNAFQRSSRENFMHNLRQPALSARNLSLDSLEFRSPQLKRTAAVHCRRVRIHFPLSTFYFLLFPSLADGAQPARAERAAGPRRPV